MKYFPTMTSQQFTAAHKYYSTKSSTELAKFWEYSANAMDRYIKTGRVDYINNLVADALACGRYRAFTRVNKSLCAHEFDEATKQFVGKADKAKLKKLRKETEDGVAKWEQAFYDHMQKEHDFSKSTPKNDWSMEKRVLNLVKACLSHEESHDKVRETFDKAWREAEKERAVNAA